MSIDSLKNFVFTLFSFLSLCLDQAIVYYKNPKLKSRFEMNDALLLLCQLFFLSKI